MSEQKEYNLINLFRNYHKLSIPSYIGTTANSIFHGLLYKFNEMGFPELLKISNKELLHLSGIADIRTFRHARQKLLNYLHNESDTDSHLIKMFANGANEYSVYSINYVILQENYSNVTRKMQVGDKDRANGSGDLCMQPAKNALLSDTIQDNTIQDKYIYNDQARVLRGLIVEKYDICNPLENRNIPTLQFLIDLQKQYDIEYIKQKIAELPNVIEHREISRTLRSWCEHPEKSQPKQATPYGTPEQAKAEFIAKLKEAERIKAGLQNENKSNT